MPDSAGNEAKLDEKCRITVGEQQYLLGGVTYYIAGHYTAKIFLPPHYIKACVYDNNKPDRLRRSKPYGRPNCLLYFKC